ncbi:MAG: DM13 domain-containing protein [Paracoccaceae bacterium]
MFKSLKSIVAVLFAAVVSTQAVPAIAGDTVGKGTFVGASDHVTTGSVEVVKNSDGSHTVTLGSDFTFDGAPDPRVGFGKDGKYDTSTGMGVLQSNNGKQSYIVPAGVDPSDYNEVYVYCLQFTVPLGVATLN